MTHKLENKNIINIKIDTKKKKSKSRRKKHLKNNHINQAYSNIATMLGNTNKPQQLDLSTATSREKEGIITKAIEDVKRDNNLLLIEDKKGTPKKLAIKDRIETYTPFKDQTPTNAIMKRDKSKSPFTTTRMRQNDFPLSYDNYDYDSIPEKSNPFYQNPNVTFIDESTKPKRGRKIAQRIDESKENFDKRIEVNKKAMDKYKASKHVTVRDSPMISRLRSHDSVIEKAIPKNDIFKTPIHNSDIEATSEHRLSLRKDFHPKIFKNLKPDSMMQLSSSSSEEM